MRKPLLVVITGADGSGKSSLIAELVKSLNLQFGEGFAVSTSVWDSMLLFKAFKKEDVEKYLNGLSGSARSLFIFHALSQSLSLALSGKAKVIFSDGYFYKYVVSELAYGVDRETVQGASVGFPKPDFSFYLDIAPEEAASRKSKITTYEGGSSFIDFQKKMAIFWAEIEKKYGPWTHLASSTSIAERVKLVLEQIGNRVKT
jgi:thymidylate kinase